MYLKGLVCASEHLLIPSDTEQAYRPGLGCYVCEVSDSMPVAVENAGKRFALISYYIEFHSRELAKIDVCRQLKVRIPIIRVAPDLLHIVGVGNQVWTSRGSPALPRHSASRCANSEQHTTK